MAARRLAISSLLCSDDPPHSSPLSSPPPPLPSSSSAHLRSPPEPQPSHEYRLSQSPSGIHSTSNVYDVRHESSRDVVPLSLQSVHIRRHTPSPRSAEYPRTPPTTSTRGLLTSGLLDYTLHREEDRVDILRGATRPSHGYESAESSSQRQHLLAESSSRYIPSRRISDPYQQQPHSPQNLHLLARPSSSRSAQSEPALASYSYTQQLPFPPVGHSPSRSPNSAYSLPPPRHPSHSPALSSRPISASPVNRHYAQQQASPIYSSPQQPYHSPESFTHASTLAGSIPGVPHAQDNQSAPLRSIQPRIFPTSLTSHTLPDSVVSPQGNTAMPLPTIVHKTSPVLSPSSGDFGGLEALVQAATEERRRLSGEVVAGDSSRREVSPLIIKSPALGRGNAHLEVPHHRYIPRSPTTSPVNQIDLRLNVQDTRADRPFPRGERDLDGEPPMKKRRSSGEFDSRAAAEYRHSISPAASSIHLEGPASHVVETRQVVSADVLLSPDSTFRDILHNPHTVGNQATEVPGKCSVAVTDVGPTVKTEPPVMTKKFGNAHHRERENEARKEGQEKKMREGSTTKRKEEKRDKDAIRDDLSRAEGIEMGDQDPHEWLLEHYSATSPPRPKRPLSPDEDKARASGSLPSERSPQYEGSKEASEEFRAPARSLATKKPKRPRSPTRTLSPLAILEQELDGADASAPHLGRLDDSEVNLELDLAISTTPDASTAARDDPMDLDVEDELLSLVDDRPRLSYSSRPVQKAPFARPRAGSTQPGKLSVNATPARPSSASHAEFGRSSMPPPPIVGPVAAKEGTQGSLLKKDAQAEGASAANGNKKKDATKKPPAKPKQPAKPKAKPAATAPKPKAKGGKDGVTAAPSPASSTLTATTPALANKGKKGSPMPGSGHKRAASATITPTRSRSASVMPGVSAPPEAEGKGDEEKEEERADDKLYCICKTSYDEDRVMIACDRCDEWYHTHCVNMPDLEVDLVDQFICPPCVERNPHLHLRTTYKRRCLAGLKHPNPSSSDACHKPARGILSKYCSDECGLTYMQARIDAWAGDKHRLWESVKDAEKREGIVVRAVAIAAQVNGITKAEDATAAPVVRPHSDTPLLEVVKASKTRIERELARLYGQLEKIAQRRDQLKKNMDAVFWREKLLQLATARAEPLDECGWDQRLCFDDEECAEFGAGVLESYEDQGQDAKENGDAMQVDDVTNEDSDWWCRGKKKCGRHAGWQKLRAGAVESEREAMEAAILKLTGQEREIRKQIEDVGDPQARPSATAVHMSPLRPLNGKLDLDDLAPPIAKINGDMNKKGKKKKN
ncbi:hypothetical protein OBBRIDRAFT_3509 [Obba rivulosa]|uniref:PHD-type domain-containing protein n=1 Tax=Obba rivulosa TaxID=1052685 RepID=A0A8E2DVA4_9APHY|nr:hypothetical protein OBBRIDRAFT_3509 [Obba rivulosa]